MKDLYAALGLTAEASQFEIRCAFRAIARASHPDVRPDDPASAARFNEAAAAYEILSDQAKRAAYDRSGEQPIRSLIDLLLERQIGQAVVNIMLPSAPRAKQAGPDVLVVLNLPAGIWRSGGATTWPGYTAAGRLDQSQPFDVPSDVTSHPWCRMPGLGELGRNGGDPGDFFVLVTPARP